MASRLLKIGFLATWAMDVSCDSNWQLVVFPSEQLPRRVNF